MSKTNGRFMVAMAAAMAMTFGMSVSAEETRVVTDGAEREVEIPAEIKEIVCLNVGALRYTCYMQAQDLVCGVEDYEQTPEIARPYSYVFTEQFQGLPVVGTNGEHYPEEIIAADPEVIIMSGSDAADADSLQNMTGIPVVVVPGSDKMMDEAAYETIRIMGEVYGKETRAQELISYMDSVKEEMDTLTAGVPEEEKPTVYVGGVSYKGAHGFEGTEAAYGPFTVTHARNLADETGQKGPFDIELEQVLAWNPDVIFVDYSGLDLIKKDYETNAEFYKQLQAVQDGKVYAQIPFRYCASNLELALADTWYVASVLYPEQFAEVNVEEKVSETFDTLLGMDITDALKEKGYEFGTIQIGE